MNEPPRVVRDPRSLFDVTGRSVLITGATGAFGRVAGLSLAAAGARVTLAARNASRLEAVGQELKELGGEAVLVNLRPDELSDAEAMVAAAVHAHGRLDCVVTAAGLNKVGLIVDQDPADWDEVQRANVRGTWLVCKAAGRQLIDQGDGGKVVLVSSTRGRLGLPGGYGAYSPSKGAVDLLCKTLACEWGRHRINVNAVAPTVPCWSASSTACGGSEPGGTGAGPGRGPAPTRPTRRGPGSAAWLARSMPSLPEKPLLLASAVGASPT